MKLFDETFLDLLMILTPVIVMPIIFTCIAIAWFSSHYFRHISGTCMGSPRPFLALHAG